MSESNKAPVVLIAEDERDIRRMIATFLGRNDKYEILEAANGAEALELMRFSRPDLVLLDLMMPKVTGWEVLETRRGDDDLARIPVIVVSANRGVELSKAMSDDIVALLPKPIDLPALASLVETAVGS